MGDNTIHYLGHVRMMGAVQPFISGAISKTVNLPEDVTVEDVEQLHIDAWRMGIKAVAIYRDNCKVAQPLSTTKKADADTGLEDVPAGSEAEAHARELNEKIAGLEAALANEQARPVGDRRRRCRARAAAPAAQVVDLRLPGRRLRRVRDRRRVRGRASRRGLHEGVQAGIDAGRHHGCVLDLGEPGPAARGPTGHLCPQVHQHALRAGGDHR